MNTIENISIAIIGPVSAGKSTFFNSLCSNTCSDMKRKKTTMLPQIYQIVNSDEILDTAESIYNKNKESNEEILKLRENCEFDFHKHFVELKHKISKIPEFFNIPDKNTTYTILDMPGLNCGGDLLYYDYIKNISQTIDIYLLVFDINSGLNTTDEINIIQLVVSEIQKNQNGYIHILINKCDDIQINDNLVKLEDSELNELYERCIETINKHCLPIIDKVSITPLCSSKLYIYRGIKNNISMIDESQLDNIIRDECGKQELKKLKDSSMKRKFISGLLKKKTEISLYNDWMNNTGYNMFIKNLNNIISNYSQFIFYHVNLDVLKLYDSIINNTHQNDNFFDYIYSKINEFNLRIKKALLYSKTETPIYLLDNLQLINIKLEAFLINGSNSYTGSTLEIVNSFIEKINKYYLMIKNIFITNPIKISKEILESRRIELLKDSIIKDFKFDIFIELLEKNIINEDIFNVSITNTFNTNINNFNKIIEFLSKYDIVYLDISIDKFIEIGLNKNLVLENFLKYLQTLLNYKFNDLNIISKFITTYLKNQFIIDKSNELLLYCDFWMKINSSDIKLAGEKIQFIFLNIDVFIKRYTLQFEFNNLINLELYNEVVNIIKSILNTLNTYYNDIVIKKLTNLSIDSNSDSDIDIKQLKNLVDKSNITKNLQLKNIIVDTSDSESDEYSNSDNSVTIYKKAISNSSKRAKKIIKKGDT